MRITNSMITNGLLLDINRNAISVNKYYRNLSTGKKIQVPSDDPLSASRALKFRTNVSETEQYLKNTSQGLSWMEVTEAAFRNVNNILIKIRDLSERGANDTLTYEDREKITADIASLVDQIGLEMNVTYAGRYVFSGYRTDQPPVITQDEPHLSYTNITQYFEAKDVQYTKAYERDLTSPGGTVVKDVAVIKLAYTGLWDTELDGSMFNGVQIESVSINDPNAYSEGHYIRETGEIVLWAFPEGTEPPPLAKDLVESINGSISLFDLVRGSYNTIMDSPGGTNDAIQSLITDFASLSPSSGIEDIHRIARQLRNELVRGNNAYDNIVRAAERYGVGLTPSTSYGNNYGTLINLLDDVLAETDPTVAYPDLQSAFNDPINNASIITDEHVDVAVQLASAFPITIPGAIVYDIRTEAENGRGGLKKGELNPQVYFFCIDNTPTSPTYLKIFNEHFDAKKAGRQHFAFEFSVNTQVRINSNAPDVFTDKMYADYQAMVGKMTYLNEYTKERIITEFQNQGLTDEELEDAVAQEMQKIQITAQDRFSDLLGLCDSHISSTGTEHTDLGSRMSRLELIEKRLNDDRVNYTKLMSDNEDVDYAEAMMRLNSLQAVYQASLSAGARIMQLTLANYI